MQSSNISDTEAYTRFDHFFVYGVRSLSRVVGMRRLTKPFWNRWRAGDVDDDVLFDFLNSIRSLDDWPDAAERMLEKAEAELAAQRSLMDRVAEIRALRRLSYMTNLAHWGILPINAQKRACYIRSRDAYIEAETLAFAERYKRIDIPWGGQVFHGNLHLPRVTPAPLVILVHGIDGCKEEHLATELAMVEAGLAVLAFDGPGQAEAFLLDGKLWTPRFHEVISAAIDAVTGPYVDTQNVGVMGMSIGALWTYEAAARDPRITAIYDLGAPINTEAFARIPFIIKSKLCQITGARTDGEIREVLAQTYIDKPDILRRIGAAVRIVHGTRDRVVALADKEWLRDTFHNLDVVRDLSMRVIENGDHCCTGDIPEIRRDMAGFFRAQLPVPRDASKGD
ncbi:alpha/beta hydrolase family protein [Arenibacterium sp. CAU 1754]